ncbi:FMN reductase [Lysinimonas soli]|uniref:FMN reductase n=1 Tax=Lysinimonas soli TaxID=1074233 RepID=A0ABW0NQ92_9MICO
MAAISVVGVSGSPTRPSRTTALVDEVTRAVAASVGGESTVIELAPLLSELGAGPFRGDVGPNAREALEQVEAADVIVVGSPAYRATYTGLFKLFFDHVGQYALADKPIVLTATGGSDRHALLVEHQMRPLFGFFQALTLPLGIFANEGDFVDYRVESTELQARIATAVRRTLPLLASNLQLEATGDGIRLPVPEFARPDAF